MHASKIAALSIMAVASIYAIIQLNGFTASLDDGPRVRRLRSSRLLRAVMFWELAMGAALILLGYPQGAISLIGVAGVIALTRWAMLRFPL